MTEKTPDIDGGDNAAKVARNELLSIIERIERLAEEKKTIADDIKDVYGEAKGRGYHTKAIREIIKLRGQDQNDRLEHQAIVDTYMVALGMAAEPDTE